MDTTLVDIFIGCTLEEKANILEVVTEGRYKRTKGAVISFAELLLHKACIMYKIDKNEVLLEATAMSLSEGTFWQTILDEKYFKNQVIKIRL